MSQLNVEIPEALLKQVKDLSIREKISLDRLVSIALSAQVSAWMTKDYLAEKAKRGSWDKFQQVLTKVPDVEPEDYDRL